MSRHLSESDLEPLSEDDYRWLLSEQMETHRRLREQAQSVIRMILSGVGVVVALIGYKLYPSFQLPSRTLSIADEAVQFDGLYQEMAQTSIHVAILFAITGLGLLFFSIVKSTKVLSTDGPLPTSRHKELDNSMTLPVTDGVKGKFGEWILANDTRLVEAEREVEQSYLNIWAAFAMGFGALYLSFTAYIGSLTLMGIGHTVLVLLGPAVTIYYLRDTVQTFIRALLANGIRPALDTAADVYYDTFHHRGVGPTVKIVLLLFYSVYYVDSLNFVKVWITLFVL